MIVSTLNSVEETKEERLRRNRQESFLDRAREYAEDCEELSYADEVYRAMISAVEGGLDCPDFDTIMRDATETLNSLASRMRCKKRNDRIKSLTEWSIKYHDMWIGYCEPFGL